MGSDRIKKQLRAVSDSDIPSAMNRRWYLSYYNQDSEGRTRLHNYMLHTPCFNDSAEILIEATWPTSLFDISDNRGMTAMHIAAIQDQVEIARELLVAGANPMIKDIYGFIPLHYACKYGFKHMAMALTEVFNAHEILRIKLRKLRIRDLSRSIYEENNLCQTPLDLAYQNGHLDILQVFNHGLTF